MKRRLPYRALNPTWQNVVAVLQANEAMLREKGAAYAGLFDSAARGEMRPNSDLDLLVHLRDPDDFEAVRNTLEDLLEETFGRRADIQYPETVGGVGAFMFDRLAPDLKPAFGELPPANTVRQVDEERASEISVAVLKSCEDLRRDWGIPYAALEPDAAKPAYDLVLSRMTEIDASFIRFQREFWRRAHEMHRQDLAAATSDDLADDDDSDSPEP